MAQKLSGNSRQDEDSSVAVARSRLYVGDHAGAYAILTANLASRRNQAPRWLLLAKTLYLMRNGEAGSSALERAAILAAGDAQQLLEVVAFAMDKRSLERLMKLLHSAEELRPTDVEIALCKAFILKCFGMHDKSFRVIREILSSLPANPMARLSRAEYYLRRGEFPKAWKDYEARWEVTKEPKFNSRAPTWDGCERKTSKVLIWAEQGIGDSILASRFLPLVRQKVGAIYVVCRSVLSVALGTLITKEELVIPDQRNSYINFPIHDYQISMMELMAHFIRQWDDVPRAFPLFATAPIGNMRYNCSRIDHMFYNIGIVWSGEPKQPLNRFREVPLRAFARISTIANVRLYTLQKGVRGADVYSDGMTGLIEDIGIGSFEIENTAHVMKKMDLVITVDTAMAHLAGAMGVPVWTLLSGAAYWVYGMNSDRTHWYPSMRLYRQQALGEWQSVFDRIYSDLLIDVKKWAKGRGKRLGMARA